MTQGRERHFGSLVAALLLLLLAVGSTPAADAPGAVPSAAWRRLDKAVRDLAKKGRAPEVEALVEHMRLLGRDGEALDTLRAKARKDLSRSRRRAAEVPAVAKSLRKVALTLAETLPALEGDALRHRATVILALDGSNVPAHETLGHVLVDGVWMPPEMPAILERRAGIAEAIRTLRNYPIEVEHGESDLPVFEALYGERGRRVSWRNQVALHSVRFTPAKLERMLLMGLRATALTRYVKTGVLDANLTDARLVIAALGSRADYERSISAALTAGGLRSNEEDMARRTSAYHDHRGYTVTGRNAEGLVAEGVHYFLYSSFGQPCLDLGHMNWICLSFIGVRFPGVAQVDVKERLARESRTVTSKEKREREEMLILSQAGIAGLRSYIRYLAARGEDPPWSASMMDQIAKIQGDDLVKTTSVVEYLQERGIFADVWEATRPGAPTAAGEPAAAFERALGVPLSVFERDWKRWVLPRDVGLASRLEGEGAEAPVPKDATQALVRLREIRAEAFEHLGADIHYRVRYDAELSSGCKAHALYLDRHPEQTAAWPDAHEEYADKEGFSPAGSVAGLSSVIAPGAASPEAALDAWLGTFYHRLPLLDPGLVRVGWGYEAGIAVLDAGSMVAPPLAQLDVVWPPWDAKGISPTFRPELPNPVPGADQSAWGTCVTLQTFHDEEGEPDIEMHLYEGGAVNAAREVECHFSSPSRPTNPELAPPGAYALLPKSHLKKKTRYTVLVKGLTLEPEKIWSFTTGSK